MSKALSSRLVEQTECKSPSCISSDAYSIYVREDGSNYAKCYSCGFYDPSPYKDTSNVTTASPVGTHNGTMTTAAVKSVTTGFNEPQDVSDYLTHPIRELKDRGISYATCEHYGVRVGVNTTDGVTPIYHLYPVTKNSELTGFYKRTLPKSFTAIGEVNDPDLFGANVVKPTGKKIFITEGVLDCLSLYQAIKETSNIDWEPSVVSIPNGTQSAVKSISANLDLLSGYEQVILCFDNDVPGKEASDAVCKLLAGKVYVSKITEKDPNAMLLAGKAEDLKWAVLTHARKYQPDGILNAADCWDRYKNSSNATCIPYPDTMHGLNEKTYGVRPGTIVTVTAGSGSGKTQFLRELKYHFWKNTDINIADIALEEDVGDTIGGMLSLHLNKRITLPDVNVEESEEKRAFDELFGDGRFTLYDFFGGMDDDSLFSKLKYFIATGHKMIFLDHLSIIVSEYASEGGERERIDTIMTKLAKIVKETGAIIFLVVHLKKSGDSSRKTFEEGTIPTLDDLRGSASIKQLSWDVFGLSRNQQHPDPICANTVELTSLKCRFTGRTGHAGFLYFDDSSGRMISTSEPVGYRARKKL